MSADPALGGGPPLIVACLKWVAHPGEPNDERFAGMSPADQSALELALQQAAALGPSCAGVTAVTVGPAGADKVLRDALASGATRAVRIHTERPMLSHDVAAAIASVVADAAWVWCGDYSLDRGTGSVPAFLAARLGAQQALGVIAVDPAAAIEQRGDGAVGVTRRLDGGRREMLHVSVPAVVSVEGATAHLRRAGLAAMRAAGRAEIEVLQPTTPAAPDDAVVRPYRPRARALAAPAGEHSLDRLRALTDAGAAVAARGETAHLAPADAAARIAAALRDWGYLPEG
ncbi:MAG: mycofactocin-associated electron transfer flavoprotein beta subunit [Actinomycetota bacterium]|nr:mycofactocin-associated electron transfer flavoprotein beta subunit [Actinomycetota bacterium]